MRQMREENLIRQQPRHGHQLPVGGSLERHVHGREIRNAATHVKRGQPVDGRQKISTRMLRNQCHLPLDQT
jgi:hypothetical protein